MTESSNKIEVRDLRKAFAGKIVLDGVDLEVRRGESLVVIGGSGTGKSVLIKNIIGILHPDSGSIKVDGEEAVGMSAQDREAVTAKFGMLFQGAALFDSLPVWENVSFGLMAGHGASRADAREIATEKLRQVGLGPGGPNCRRPNCRAACRNSSVSPAPSRRRRKSCFSMNRPPGSTRSWPT